MPAEARKLRAAVQVHGLDRRLLVERLKLEESMRLMCPRFLSFITMCMLLSLSLVGLSIEKQGRINGLLSSSYKLGQLRTGVNTMESIRTYMKDFADTASNFYPINEEYVPDPERLKITTGLKTYVEARALPSDIRPRIRKTFTLTAWVGSEKESWVVRAVPRGVQLQSSFEVCWGWRYPAKLVFGFHDLAVDQPNARMQPIQISATPAPPLKEVLSMEALVVNGSHALFYRDAELVDVIGMPRVVTDCMDNSLLVGDVEVDIGQLTYFPRALSSAELYEIKSDGMSLLEIVSGGTPKPPKVTDADFTTERVLVEATSARQDRIVQGSSDAVRSTRSTIALQGLLSAAPLTSNATVTLSNDVSSNSSDWAFIVDMGGIAYSGTPANDAVTIADPVPTANSSFFSLTLNFKLPLDVYQTPVLKLKRPYAPSEVVDTSDICWGLFIDGLFNNIQVFRGPPQYSSTVGFSLGSTIANQATIVGGYLDCAVPDADNAEWQHMAFVSNGSKIALYLRGNLLCDLDLLSQSDYLTDCEGGVIRVGGLEYASETSANFGENYGIKKYGRAISAAEVAIDATCQDDPATDDTTWTDPIGNGCAFYAQFIAENGYSLCTDATKSPCPIACGVTRACPTRTKTDSFMDRTLQFSPPVLCMTDAGDADLAHALPNQSSMSGRRLGHLPQVTGNNAYSYKAAGQCTGGSLNNYDVTDYTIVFWTRGENHMMQLLADFDGTGDVSVSSQFRRYCFEFTTPEVTWTHSDGDLYYDLRPAIGKLVKPGDWIMRAATVNATHVCTFLNGENTCKQAPFVCPRIIGVYVAALSAATENLHTMEISPIRTYSPALSEPALTRMYYNERSHYMAHINGPKTTDKQESSLRSIELLNYPRKSFNFVPPLTFQSRYPEAAIIPCKGFAATSANIFAAQRELRCRGYDCGLDDAADVVQCIDDKVAASTSNGTYFGRSSNLYSGSHVFSEFLHTFKSELLYRDGEEMNLASYINARTIEQKIIMLVYTPIINTATMLTVSFDFVHVEPRGSYTIQHYRGLTDDVLQLTLVCDILLAVMSVVTCLLTVPQIMSSWRDLVAKHKEKKATNLDSRASLTTGRIGLAALCSTFFRIVLEIFLCLVIILFAAIHATRAMRSDQTLFDTFNPALQIKWADPDVPYNAKLDAFFSSVESIDALLQQELVVSSIAFILMLLCIVRLIGYMTVHPRINLLVATMTQAADEVVHFFVSFAVIFMMFAMVAHAFFGTSRTEYATLSSAVLTQLYQVFGRMTALAQEEISYIIYTVLLYTVLSLFLLKFFLAIIIASYNVVKKKVVDQITEQSIFTDTADIVYLAILRQARRWPTHRKVLEKIDLLPSGDKLSMEQLAGIFDGDAEKAATFAIHYASYPFLQPAMDDVCLPTVPITPSSAEVANLEDGVAVVVSKLGSMEA